MTKKKGKRKKKRNKITPFQMRQGIYLDFEGCKDQPPALAGFLIGEEFKQVVFDPALASAADAKGIPVENLCDFVGRLLDECKRNRRFIIGFAQFEMDVIERECGVNIATSFKNGLGFARRWVRRKKIEVENNKLETFLKLKEVNYAVPSKLKKGSAANWLRRVRSGLEYRGEYSKLIRTQEECWDNLLEYNRHDVLGLRALVERASQDLKR